MWNTFKYTLITLVKEKSIVIWALLFPLIMSTLFSVMFAGIDDAMSFSSIPVAVVDDENYQDTEAFSQMIETLSEDNDDRMLITYFVADTHEAEALMLEGAIDGYFSLDREGVPQLVVASSNSLSMSGSFNQTILKIISDNYIRSQSTIETLINENPQALSDASIIESLFATESFTEEISIVANKASGSVRYFYSLLGFAALMAAQVSLIAITRTQANLSAIGARRAVGATSRAKTLTATLLASWLISFGCLVLAFCFMRFVLDINFGGRESACILGLVVASLMATALGAFIGSIPKIGEGTKAGILTGITCLLALFAGLYGDSSQKLADSITRDFPTLQLFNPSKQVADLFYSLYFYDSYEPFFTTIGILVITAVVFFLFAVIFMRRQRYASI